jgi:hypothetical protein
MYSRKNGKTPRFEGCVAAATAAGVTEAVTVAFMVEMAIAGAEQEARYSSGKRQ